MILDMESTGEVARSTAADGGGITVIKSDAPSNFHIAPRSETLNPTPTSVAPPPPKSHHTNQLTVVAQPSQTSTATTMMEGISGEPMKKKRGRPRKYAPNGQVSLGLSPMPCATNKSKDSSDPNAPKPPRGRPPGTGRKQRLANLGEWMNTSAGLAFAPHVISVGAGEDVVSKVMSFSQQRPRVLCIMSGTGTVSSVTLRQPASTAPSLTFEGRFDILSLGGSYLVNEEGGPKSRTGGLSVSLSGPEGHVIGGAIGMLIAASLVQVVACSFVYGGNAKPNNNNIKNIKQEKSPKEEQNNSQMEIASVQAAQQTPQKFSGMRGWPGSGSGRNLLTDIDLTRG